MIYVASSWRNPRQAHVVTALIGAGHEVYDFKNPPGGTGFHWSEVMPSYDHESAHVDEYLAALEHPRSVEGFNSDFDAMKASDKGILVLPCGRSAHDEIGWLAGSGRATAILLDPDERGHITPELMYKMHDLVTADLEEIIRWAK